MKTWCKEKSRQQQCFLVFWHDAVAAALAADVTRAKTLSLEGRKRGAEHPTHIAVRKSNLES
jgi:hypothetical protein